MVAKAKSLGTMRIYSSGHMTLDKWIVGLERRDDCMHRIIMRLFRLLQTHDWQGATSSLLVDFPAIHCGPCL